MRRESMINKGKIRIHSNRRKKSKNFLRVSTQISASWVPLAKVGPPSAAGEIPAPEQNKPPSPRTGEGVCSGGHPPGSHQAPLAFIIPMACYCLATTPCLSLEPLSTLHSAPRILQISPRTNGPLSFLLPVSLSKILLFVPEAFTLQVKSFKW